MTKEQKTASPSPTAPGQSPGAGSPPTGAGPETPEASGGKMAIIIALCVLLVGAAVWFAHDRAANAAAKGAALRSMQAPAVPVLAATVAQKDVPIYLEGIATVQAFNTVTVSARVDGQIKKIAFTEGQDVHAGDLLAQIDPDPYRAALDEAVAKKGQDEAQLANARVDLKRYADLLAKQGVTEQQYATQQALVDQFIATVAADQAAIESAKVQLDYTTIVSPIDGRTGIRLVDQGNIVHGSNSNGVVVITQLKPISVVFLLPEQALDPIQEQTRGATDPDLTVLAVSRDHTTVLDQGKLAVIDNQIDPNSAQIRLKATFPNANLRLWPGQFVYARLLLTVQKNCIVVPKEVIQVGPDGDFAFVIRDDQTVEARPLKLAPKLPAQANQPEVVVADGLRPGERVVVEGQAKLVQGSRIRLADAEGKPEGQNPKAEGSAKSEGRSPKAKS